MSGDEYLNISTRVRRNNVAKRTNARNKIILQHWRD
ncbi:MAG: hypothetical protein JWQ96_1747 [Segetibacter sp.]|nr:hypothetical protein [Segetibacter sp.]